MDRMVTKVSSFNSETCRYRTFRNFPFSFPNKCTLALAGFYYIGPGDDVRCHFCRILINRWEQGDDVFKEHRRWSPSCPLICGEQTDNVPINPRLFHTLLADHHKQQTTSYDVCCRNEAQTSSSAPTMTTPPPPPSTDPPAYPEYAGVVQRLDSYETWTNASNPFDLAQAGFFYTLKDDRVKCFNCAVGLRDWDTSDKPWEQHALRNSLCSYLVNKMGTEYIKRVILASKERKNIKDHLVDVSCTICMQRNYNTVFLPCNHVAACQQCSQRLVKCPICKSPFERCIVIYLC